MDPKDKKHPKFASIADKELVLFGRVRQCSLLLCCDFLIFALCLVLHEVEALLTFNFRRRKTATRDEIAKLLFYKNRSCD